MPRTKQIAKQSNCVHAYVIGLQKPLHAFSQLENTGLCTQWLQGTRGSALTDKELQAYFHPLWATLGPPSALGIAISHMRAWIDLLHHPDRTCAAIFEDDVVVTPQFANELKQAIHQVPADFDILYLGRFGTETVANVFTLAMIFLGIDNKDTRKVNDTIVKPRVALALHGYIVSRQGAQKLLHALYGQVYNHLDLCIQTLAHQNKINVYAVEPKIAFQTSTDKVVSTNITNTHPLVVNKLIENVYLDTLVRSNYITTLSLFRIGALHVTLSSVAVIILGLVLAKLNIPMSLALMWFCVASVPDILEETYMHTMFHGLLFLLPFT